jgi:hypothetical protein
MSKRRRTAKPAVTKRVERAATVSERVAIDELLKAYPGARLASFTREGKVYVAQIRVAAPDFPPAPAKDPLLDAPAPADDFGADLGDDLAEADPLEAQVAELTDLVRQIADAVGVTDEDPLGDADGEVEEIPLDDDAEAEAIPAEDSDPKFAKHQDYAKVASRSAFQLEREDASALSNVALIREATSQFPGFRVAKLDRMAKADEGTAVIDMVRVAPKG